MFYLSYLGAELRRRRGRTLLTALGLGVGVGLVVAVAALSKGLDRAQDEVLAPLTGVGTDLSVTRPLQLEGGSMADLAPAERERLEEENGAVRVGLRGLGDPGERFSTTSFTTATQLSFPESEVETIAGLDGVQAAAGGLTVTAMTVSGKVPEGEDRPPMGAASAPGGSGDAVQVGPPPNIDMTAMSISGVDPATPDLAAVSPSEVSAGRYLADDDDAPREALVNVSYAKREGIAIGDDVELDGQAFAVVGLVKTPLGGQASDVYVELGRLQRIADKRGRVNVVYARADDADAVPAVRREIRAAMDGASVTTAADLAERVGGSLVDARNLSGKLGTALTIVALVAAFLIAALLTLASVAKRVRELGTLKAIGWPQRLVVRQVTGESVAQGLLGGIVGAALGLGAAALITAIGPTLQATVADAAPAAAAGAGGPPSPGGLGAFGQSIASGSTSVTLEAPVDLGLVALAIGLAVLGGLLAGAVGGLRAARLRPATALRHID